jgi:hypothetical protein
MIGGRSDLQVSENPLDRPSAALLGLDHDALHLALEFTGKLGMIGQSESVFFSSRFSAMTSAMTFFMRVFSAASFSILGSGPSSLVLRAKTCSAL